MKPIPIVPHLDSTKENNYSNQSFGLFYFLHFPFWCFCSFRFRWVWRSSFAFTAIGCEKAFRIELIAIVSPDKRIGTNRSESLSLKRQRNASLRRANSTHSVIAHRYMHAEWEWRTRENQTETALLFTYMTVCRSRADSRAAPTTTMTVEQQTLFRSSQRDSLAQWAMVKHSDGSQRISFQHFRLFVQRVSFASVGFLCGATSIICWE